MKGEDGHVGGEILFLAAFSVEDERNRGAVRRGQTEERFVFALRAFTTGNSKRTEQNRRIRVAAVSR
jgi:hypothetical protein